VSLTKFHDQQVLAITCIILWRHFDLSFGGEDAQAGKDRHMGIGVN
jgi:hypothetical protein